MKGEATLMYELNLLLPDISSKKYGIDEKFTVLKGYLTELNETLSIALSSLDTENLSPSLSQKLDGAAKKRAFIKRLKKTILRQKSLKKRLRKGLKRLKATSFQPQAKLSANTPLQLKKARKKLNSPSLRIIR